MRLFEHYRKIEIVSVILMWGLTIGTGIYLAAMYPQIPETIPTHFGLWGEPDNWGNKASIFVIYAIQVIVLLVEQWALQMSIKSSEQTGGLTMVNRDSIAVTGPIISGLFGWCIVGTVWLGRLGKYFVFITLGLVVMIVAICVISQKKDTKRLRVHREQILRDRKDRQKNPERKREDTLEIPELKFRGKVDLWAWILLIFLNGLMVWIMFNTVGEGQEGLTSALICLAVLVLTDILMVPMYFRNYILLQTEELLVVFGLIKKRIRYENIELLEPTHNPLSSLAMSLDRIYIHTISGDDVLVAVKEKQEFIEEVYRRMEIGFPEKNDW